MTENVRAIFRIKVSVDIAVATSFCKTWLYTTIRGGLKSRPEPMPPITMQPIICALLVYAPNKIKSPNPRHRRMVPSQLSSRNRPVRWMKTPPVMLAKALVTMNGRSIRPDVRGIACSTA